jgi:anti-sigma factor RsiW
MRRDAVLDLMLLEADGGLPPADADRLEQSLAEDPSLQDERASIHAAWRELQALGSGIVTPGECADADALELATTSTRRASTTRDHAPAPARRRRSPLRKRR